MPLAPQLQNHYSLIQPAFLAAEVHPQLSKNGGHESGF
jgi:hypothetical protein